MHILIDDSTTFQLQLKSTLLKLNYEVVVATNGREAFEVLQQQNAPPLAILNVDTTDLSGIEICQKVRALSSGAASTYIILLIDNNSTTDGVTALKAGADDYITYPLNTEELHAHIRAGIRIANLQSKLDEHGQLFQKMFSQFQRNSATLAEANENLVKEVTIRGRVEEELRLQKILLEAQSEASIDGILVVSIDGKIINFNKRFLEICGIPEEVVATGSAKALIKPVMEMSSNPEESLRLIDHLVRHPNEKSSHEVILKDARILDRYSAPVKSAEGVCYGRVWYFRDITQRKRSEEALKKSEQKLSLHIQQTPLAVIEWNLNAEVTEWNPAAEAILGYSKEEVFARKAEGFSFLVPEFNREYIAQIWTDLISKKVGQHNISETLTKDGRTIICEWYNTPLINREGSVIGVASMVQDITERKQLEKDLEQTRDAALDSVRLKSEFLANMSHEIRTPMNGVIGMTEMLLDTDLTQEQREFAEIVRNSGDSLLTIINDILDFSKIEAGKLDLEIIDFDLRQSVEDVVELLAERAQSKELELASLVYNEVPDGLRGDPGRLRQILTNIVGNAIKFTDHGEVSVKAKVAEQTDESVMVRFEVTDTGVGISAEVQSRLFQSFSQADGSTTRKYGGTGLGLAISKQLVELMNGEIGIESKEGGGSTFWFTVRFDVQQNPKQDEQIDKAQLINKRVLIVDDNSTNRKILTYQVNSWGMIADEAEGGVQARRMLRAAAAKSEAYDLVILDLIMPGMDGLELAHSIKADSLIADTRLVMLTSFGSRDNQEAAQRAGIDAYFAKPVRQMQLLNTLLKVVGTSLHSHVILTLKEDNEIKIELSHINSVSLGHILIAEDNIINQKIAKLQVEKLGYRVDVVANGFEVIEALSRISYSLVLMDCQMPEMGGFEATAEIRKREGMLRHTPIIAMTANAMEGEREKCIDAGMDDYITKPVKRDILSEVIEKWMPKENLQIIIPKLKENIQRKDTIENYTF